MLRPKSKSKLFWTAVYQNAKLEILAKSLFHAPFSSIYVQGENRDDWNAKFLRDIGASGRHTNFVLTQQIAKIKTLF